MGPKDAQHLIAAELRKFDFRGSAGSYSLPLAPGVSGFLGATCTTGKGEPVTVWLVVGVRHDAVYTRGLVLGGYATSETNPTLAVAMKDLAVGKSVGEYCLTGSPDADQAELRRLVHDVTEYAIPFYSRFATIAGAIEALANGEVIGLQNSEVFVPVALLEQGESQEAVTRAIATLATMDTKRGTGRQYAVFAERVMKAVTQ